MRYLQTFLLEHILKETARRCKHKVCHLFQNSSRVRTMNWIPASGHASLVDGEMVHYNDLPPLERALPYLVDTLYEELDSITRLLAARPLGSLIPRDLEVIGHLIKVSSDFRARMQQSAPPAQPSPSPDREPAEERPCSLVCVPPRPMATPRISATDCDPRMVDAGPYQPTTGHNSSVCQEEHQAPESGPPDPLPSPRDVAVLLLRPTLDCEGKPLVYSDSNQESRTSRKLHSTSKLQPIVSCYMTIARRLSTKVSKIVSNRRRD